MPAMLVLCSDAFGRPRRLHYREPRLTMAAGRGCETIGNDTMKKSNFAVRLQQSLLDEARKLACTEGVVRSPRLPYRHLNIADREIGALCRPHPLDLGGEGGCMFVHDFIVRPLRLRDVGQ